MDERPSPTTLSSSSGIRSVTPLTCVGKDQGSAGGLLEFDICGNYAFRRDL
jgi:hypothetical protein